MKIYRAKRRSCAFCKPHKVGWTKMWTDKDHQKIKLMDREIRTRGAE